MKRLAMVLAGISLTALGCSKAEPVTMEETGTLEEGDLLYPEDQSFYDEYEFRVGAGMTISVTMESDDFDAFLHLVGPEIHEVNDDCEGTNACIEFVAPANGTYTVYANSLYAPDDCEPPSADEEPPCAFGGAYTVSITTTN